MLIIGSSAASVSFIFINMLLFEENETGAKVFYMIVTSALYIVLPGFVLLNLFMSSNVMQLNDK